MANPTSYGPLIQRIREITEQGLGTLRVVPAGRFSGDASYAGRDADAIARDVLHKPQILVRIGSKTNQQRTNTNMPFHMQDIDVIVELYYKMDGSLMRDRRQELITEINDDAFKVQGALTRANNLTETVAGEPTGFSSGRLEWRDTTEVDDRTGGDGAATITLRFSGVVTLNYV